MNINSADLIKNFERAANEKGVYLDKNGDCVSNEAEKGTLSQLNELIRNLGTLLIDSKTGKSDIEKLMGYYKIVAENDVNQILIRINKTDDSIFESNQKNLEKSHKKLNKIKRNFQEQMKWFHKSLNEVDLHELTGQKDTLSFINYLIENLTKTTLDPKEFLTMRGQCSSNHDEKAPLSHVQKLVEKAVYSLEDSDMQNKLLNQFLKWLDRELQNNAKTPLAEVSEIAEKCVYLIQQLDLPSAEKEALLDDLFLLYHNYLDQQITVHASNPDEIKKIENEKQFYLKVCQQKTSLLSPIHPSIQATATIHIIDRRLSEQLTPLPLLGHSPTLARHSFIPIAVENSESHPYIKKIETMDYLQEVRHDVLEPGKTYAYYKTTTSEEEEVIRKAPEIIREETYLKIINILTQWDSPFVVPAARITLHHSLSEKTQEQQSIVMHKQVAIPDAKDWSNALFYLYQQPDSENLENQFDIEKIQEAAILMGDTGQYDLHGKNGFVLRDSKTNKIYFAFNDNGRSLTPTNFFFSRVHHIDEHYLPFRFAAMLTPICTMPLEKAVKERSLEQLTYQRLEEIEDQLRGKGKIDLLSIVRHKLNHLDESAYPESIKVIEKLKKLISTTPTLDHKKEEKTALEKEFWEIIKGKKSIEEMTIEFQKLLESDFILIRPIILELKTDLESIPSILTEAQIKALMERLRKKRDVLQSEGEVSCLDIWKAQYPAFQLFLNIVKAQPSRRNKEHDIASDYRSFEFYLKNLKRNNNPSYDELKKTFDELVNQAESAEQVIKYYSAVNKYK